MIPRRKAYFSKDTYKLICGVPSTQNSILEHKFSKSWRIPNPVLVASGRVALKLILSTSDIKPGSEIVMPSYTFGYLATIVRNLGFVPRFVGVDRCSLQMDVKSVKEVLTHNTGAILATHLYGSCCDIQSIIKLARRKKIKVIEDCAQSFGGTLSEKKLGTFGNIAFTSFNIAKPLQGIGGGLVFGVDKKWVNKVRVLVHKCKRPNNIDLVGCIKALAGHVLIQTQLWYLFMYLFGFPSLQQIFFRCYRRTERESGFCAMPELYAAIVTKNLVGFDRRLTKRRSIKSLYGSLLKNKLIFPSELANVKGSVCMVPAIFPGDMFKLRRFLALKGIDIAIGNEVNELLVDENRKNIISSIISLPVYENMGYKDIKYVADSITEFINLES